MKRRLVATILAVVMVASSLMGCASSTQQKATEAATTKTDTEATKATEATEAKTTEAPKTEAADTSGETEETKDVKESSGTVAEDSAISSGLSLGDYTPAKKEYNFYFTYKLVHAWWDAVGLGLEEAQKLYADQGITIKYEYTAPVTPDAIDQVNRLEEAAGRNFDVIGVDVNDIDIVTPTINNLINQDVKVMTFSSSDATKEDGCERIAYVGNTHNYEDGYELAEILAEKVGYKGQVAGLAGTIGAPCHEDRIRGFQDVMEKYPDIEVVEIQYDNDSIEQALTFTEGFLQKYPDLKGIFCNNMGNPIGAAQAITDAGKESDIVLVGMDHDKRALEYLRDGVITALGVQDCYKMGFDTIQVAIQIADGLEPGADTYPEQTEEKTTIVYQDGAQEMLDLLYPDTK